MQGLVAGIGALEFPERLEILLRRIRAQREATPSFKVRDEVVELLAEKVTDNGRELEGAVARLLTLWGMTRRACTVAEARSLIRDFVSSRRAKPVRIDDVIDAVCQRFGVVRGDVLAQCRTRAAVHTQQIGLYVAKQLTERSLAEIGSRFGLRDHTSVRAAVRRIAKLLKTDRALKAEVAALCRELKERAAAGAPVVSLASAAQAEPAGPGGPVRDGRSFGR